MFQRARSGPSDAGSFGLFPLQSPTTERNFKAIIVAVHGAGGHYTDTWTNKSADPPFFWIKDGLDKDLPECQVFSFGYNATNISQNKANVPLGYHARNLLIILQQLLDTELKPGPIIFIAHDVGGILVKQLLIESVHSPSSRKFSIHEWTIAILFFGTRHRVLNMRSEKITLEEWYAQGANTTIADMISKQESATLLLINDKWLHLQQKYQIFSFYETRPSYVGLKSSLIVNKMEAILNTPQERIFPLNDSHMGMVKPPSPDSDTYRTVLNCLRGIVQHLPKRRRSTLSVPSAPPVTAPLITPNRIDFKGYVHLFKHNLLDATEECLLSDMLAKSPTALLSNINIERTEDTPEPLLWVHVPLNNTSWINGCLQNIVTDQHEDQALFITQQKYWLSQERKRQGLPHSRYFEPSSFLFGDERTTQFVIYLPYLHWDSTKCFKQRADYLKAMKGRNIVEIPENLSEEGKSVYKIMRDESGTSSFHPRRSLDQFFYSSLPETSSRDQDQVLSKNMPKDARGGKKMIMVDQLWLWFIVAREPDTLSRDKTKTTIFTSFPRKEKEADEEEKDLEDIADLRQAIIDEANSRDSEWATDRSNYVGLIIDQAVNIMLNIRTEESLDFLSVFRAAIGEATEAQTTFFRNFQEKMKSNSDDISDSQTKRDEVKLALEISDIIDELNSINRLFEAQRDVLDTAIKIFKSHGGYTRLVEKLTIIINQDIEGYIKQVKRMTADAQRTKDSLKDLLDLQQKEETLREAHYSNDQADAARDQADATAAQSQIILLFTIVTIVFAPLSFFTSYYGMNVREFTGDNGNTNQGAVWRVMGPFSAAIILGLLGGAWHMYKEAQKEHNKRKAKRIAKVIGGGGK